MTKFPAIIIDDEQKARTLLQGMLEEFCPQIEVVASCPDLPTGVKQIRKLKPALVFLDIEMPGHSGLELLDFFDEDENNFSIIFTTAYHQYAIQAFKLSAIDYLLKPIAPDDLEQAIERFTKRSGKQDWEGLRQNMSQGAPKKLALPTVNSVKFVDLDDILFLRADGAYTHVALQGQPTITVSRNLKTYEEALAPHPNFIRCHKSFIVNVNHVTDYIKSDGGYLLVKGGHEVAVSSDKVQEVMGMLQR